VNGTRFCSTYIVVPPYGPRPPLTALPEIPSTNAAKNGPPNPWVGAQPGAYFTVPGSQPSPGRFFYEGNVPSSLGGTSADPQHAADLARYFCQLAPWA
jgi:hypothetical protein